MPSGAIQARHRPLELQLCGLPAVCRRQPRTPSQCGMRAGRGWTLCQSHGGKPCLRFLRMHILVGRRQCRGCHQGIRPTLRYHLRRAIPHLAAEDA